MIQAPEPPRRLRDTRPLHGDPAGLVSAAPSDTDRPTATMGDADGDAIPRLALRDTSDHPGASTETTSVMAEVDRAHLLMRQVGGTCGACRGNALRVNTTRRRRE